MSRFIRYFRHIPLADKLPQLPRGYASEFDPRELTHEEATLLSMVAVRSPDQVELLKRRLGMSEHELIDALPKRHKPRRREKLWPLLRRVFGTTRYDPMKRHYLEHRRTPG